MDADVSKPIQAKQLLEVIHQGCESTNSLTRELSRNDFKRFEERTTALQMPEWIPQIAPGVLRPWS